MTQSRSEEPAPSRPAQDRQPRPVLARLGVVLILLSGVLWFSLFAIPFLPWTLGQKTALGGVVFVGVQIAWWSGAALAGPSVVKKLTGWFRRSRTDRSGD